MPPSPVLFAERRKKIGEQNAKGAKEQRLTLNLCALYVEGLTSASTQKHFCENSSPQNINSRTHSARTQKLTNLKTHKLKQKKTQRNAESCIVANKGIEPFFDA